MASLSLVVGGILIGFGFVGFAIRADRKAHGWYENRKESR